MERLTKELLISRLNEIIKISKEAIPRENWSEENYLYELPRKWELSRVVIVDDKIVGYTIISEKESSLHLHKIVVKKNSRGKGIGRMLLQNLEEIGEKSVTLKVGIENIDAKKFYASLNYIKICEGNGYETFRK